MKLLRIMGIVLMALLAAGANFGFAQGTTNTGGGGGVGGGGGSDLEAQIGVGETETILGTTIIVNYSASGGTGPYTFAFEKSCDVGPAMAFVDADSTSPYNDCASVVGAFKYKVTATDAVGATDDAEVTVTVFGPDQLQPTSSINSKSSAAPNMQVLHKFRLYHAATNKTVGPCFEASAFERIWEKVDGVWETDPDPNDPDDWEYEGKSSAESPHFFYKTGYIWDYKVVNQGASWGTKTPRDTANGVEGDVIYEYKQQLMVKIPKCAAAPNNVYAVATAVLHFKVYKIKIGGTATAPVYGVIHVLQQ